MNTTLVHAKAVGVVIRLLTAVVGAAISLRNHLINSHPTKARAGVITASRAISSRSQATAHQVVVTARLAIVHPVVVADHRVVATREVAAVAHDRHV